MSEVSESVDKRLQTSYNGSMRAAKEKSVNRLIVSTMLALVALFISPEAASCNVQRAYDYDFTSCKNSKPHYVVQSKNGAILRTGQTPTTRQNATWKPSWQSESALDTLKGTFRASTNLAGDLRQFSSSSGLRGLANEGITGQAIDPTRFAKIKAAFQRSGGVIDQGDDAQAFLRLRQAEGVTFDAKTILLPKSPTTTAVFEEFIHTAQFRTGRFDRFVDQFGNAEATRLLEIEAAQKLIRNRKAFQIPNAETRQTIQRLRSLRSQVLQ